MVVIIGPLLQACQTPNAGRCDLARGSVRVRWRRGSTISSLFAGPRDLRMQRRSLRSCDAGPGDLAMGGGLFWIHRSPGHAISLWVGDGSLSAPGEHYFRLTGRRPHLGRAHGDFKRRGKCSKYHLIFWIYCVFILNSLGWWPNIKKESLYSPQGPWEEYCSHYGQPGIWHSWMTIWSWAVGACGRSLVVLCCASATVLKGWGVPLSLYLEGYCRHSPARNCDVSVKALSTGREIVVTYKGEKERLPYIYDCHYYQCYPGCYG